MNIDNNKTLRNALKVILKEALLEIHIPSKDRPATNDDLEELLRQLGEHLDEDSKAVLVRLLGDNVTVNRLTRTAYGLANPKSVEAAERQIDSMSFR